ncbi:MAG: DNA-binding protein [Moraxellaceae bacterium]|nr:MAG: DNA-binding protein [Moraxellaceae bacterium]
MGATAKKRLTKLDKMTPEQKAAEAIKFWAAPADAMFSPETLAIVFKKSLPWFQLKRCTGGGIPFSKPDKGRDVFYKKADALAYFDKNQMHSTSTPVSA